MTSRETTRQVKEECIKEVRAAWVTGEPRDADCVLVVSGMDFTKLFGRASVFGLSNHVPIDHVVYFKPYKNALLI